MMLMVMVQMVNHFKYKTKNNRKTEARSARLELPPPNPDGSQPPQPAQLPIPPLHRSHYSIQIF